MAQSPAHRFGQIIGEVLEAAVIPFLERFAADHDLYLDKKGPRPCRGGKKCTWLDLNKNKHDLDYVLERGGSPDRVGMPAAFIETAWRRYTKHSKNKAQEIQGAIEPLADTYQTCHQFKGAILAGEFTEPSLAQLRSLGFTLLYFPYETVVRVFRKFGIDASSEEDTPDDELQEKVDAFERLSPKKKRALAAALAKSRQADVENFIKALSVSVSRQIDRIVILALHGEQREVSTINDAIRFIESYHDHGRDKPVDRYEIQVRYNNGDAIDGKFKDKATAIDFLRSYQPVVPQVI